MKFRRIFGITLRYLYLFKHNLDKSTDLFYWSSIDLILWGITTLFIQSLNPAFANVVLSIVSGLIFWQVTWRGQFEITVNILEELWNKNMINIFATPLKFSEWVASFLFLGLGKLFVTFSFISALAFVLYKIEIFIFGIYLVPLIILLLLNGWWMGMLIGSLTMRFGTRLQALTWSLPWALSPFFGIFYPISVLPNWAQKIAMIFPASYIFEGVREIIYTGSMDMKKVYISLALNIIYIMIGLLALRFSFRKILKKGLIKVY